MMNKMLNDYINESVAIQAELLKDADLPAKFGKAVDAVLAAFKSGNKVLVAGNGGSAADAQHFAAEFVGKFKMMRSAYPAISLTTDTSIITAWGNDNGFEGIFERQIEALGKEGDVFFAISTSGNSKNILLALGAAKKVKIFTIALLGGSGGNAKGLADLEFTVPSANTPRIQEMHTLILHGIAEEVEKRMEAGK